MLWVRQIIGYAAAVALAAALGSLFSTHFVLRALAADLGVAIGADAWLSTMGRDLVGMGPLFAAITAVGFLIAFPVAALIIRQFRRKGVAGTGLQYLGYGLAGAVAMATALLTMQGLLEVMPVAGARTLGGLSAQALAGAAAGLLHAWLTRSTPGKATSL